MMRIHLTEQNRNRTVLEILQFHIPAAPRAYLRRLLRRGKIVCNSCPASENDRMQGNEVLLLPDSARLRELCAAQLPEVDILLETEAFLAVFKPAGLAVHRGLGHESDNLTTRVRQLVARRRAPYRVAPVHRLDIGTSGPVLFGKGRRATAELGRMLQDGRMGKTYLALVRGRPPETGTLTSEVNVQGRYKPSATRFRVCARQGEDVLLELELLSGRKHQIRQQCAAAGWPLYGDKRYGGPCLPVNRLFLHCCQLRWNTPAGQEPACEVSSPLPNDLRRLLPALGITFQDLPEHTTAILQPEHPPYA